MRPLPSPPFQDLALTEDCLKLISRHIDMTHRPLSPESLCANSLWSVRVAFPAAVALGRPLNGWSCRVFRGSLESAVCSLGASPRFVWERMLSAADSFRNEWSLTDLEAH